MNVSRFLDVVAVLIAAIPALLLGVPALGYAVGGGAWILQRLIAVGERRFLVRVGDTRRWLGARLFASFGRIWLLAGAIVVAGVVGGRADGLTAAIGIFVAYSIAFAIRIASGPPEAQSASAPAEPKTASGPPEAQSASAPAEPKSASGPPEAKAS
jgi:hypothetical protein